MSDPEVRNNQNEAEELADLLDAVLPADADGVSYTDEITNPQVLAAMSLAAQDFPAPSLEAMARMQSHMLTAQKASINQSSRIPQQRIIIFARRMMVAAASIILVLFFASPAIHDSTPNSVLYPAKRTLEQIKLQFAGDSASTHLTLAENRMTEALQLIEQDDFQPELVEAAAEQITQAAAIIEQSDSDLPSELAGQAAAIDRLLDFVYLQANSQNDDSSEDRQRIVETVNEIDSSGNLRVLTAAGMDSDLQDENAPDVTVPMVTPESTESPEATEQADPPKILTVIADGRVNLRVGPGLDFEIEQVMEPGTQVEVLETSADEEWSRVRLVDEADGWVASFLIGISLPSNNGTVSNSTGNQGNPSSGQPTNGGTNNNEDSDSDFGCGRPGNQCNAPGRQNNSNTGRK